MTRSRVGDDVDCRALAVHYLGEPVTKSGRGWQWLCPFHADQRSPSFTVYADGYHCFGCAAHGSPVGLVMALERLAYRAAVRRLAELFPACSAQPPEQRGANWRAAGWQVAAWRLVRDAQAALAGTAGAAGRDYLAGRGIEPATWQAWSLGYVPQVRCGYPGGGQVQLLGPAITLPWTDGRRVKAVQYRLLEHPTLRYWQKAGGERTLFGVQCLCRDQDQRDVLVLVEGELNAISIWQAAGQWLDVVSFGPKGNVARAGGLMEQLAQRYARVLVWADEPAAALAARQAVGGRALAVCPADGIDANELLLAGQLEVFLAEVLAGWSTQEPSRLPGSAVPPAACTPAMGQAA